MSKKETEDVTLESVNKQLTEMKKKIQLLEGQRKAHYEMWDNEKRQNAEKIKLLKENIKRLYAELGKCNTIQKNVKLCDKILLTKGTDEALESLDSKVIEARKKLDLLQHEINQTIPSLENQIHKVEINIMEVEHLRKKYRTIKSQLVDESVGFESTLRKLEEKIYQQETEISHLQDAFEEATNLRNKTYETLAEQEKKLAEVRKTREMEIEDLRLKVENYKTELERLERHMYPSKPMKQDSLSRVGEHDDTEVNQQSQYLEKVFETLKEATGVIDTDDVLRRFLSQRDTKTVLEKMKTLSEKEKEALIKRKEEIITELETHKFADVKDQERSEEEIQAIQAEIQKENEKYEQVKEEHDKLQRQIENILEKIHEFCLRMKDFDAASVPEKCPPVDKYEWLLKLFRTKMESALRFDKNISDQGKTKNLDLWSHLPYSGDSKTSGDDDDEEDEIPTRHGLKREAQLIYETRNRRKGYRAMAKHF
ncbi:hypothetical protein V9T40_001347 [Parthenolecanium corni]|uniref:Uncharacterized protein n=1 Tax=Parthenolecanium corni TaxID=536013 RepID=A0AAN9TB14_9HEMI